MEDPKSAKNGDHEKTDPRMGAAAYRYLMKRSNILNMSKSTTLQHASEVMSAVFNVPPQVYQHVTKSDLDVARSFGNNQTPNPYAEKDLNTSAIHYGVVRTEYPWQSPKMTRNSERHQHKPT